MARKHTSSIKKTSKLKNQEMTCLEFCVNGMNDSLFDFYENNKPLYKIFLNEAKTNEEKIHKFLFFPNAVYTSFAYSKLIDNQIFPVSETIRIAIAIRINQPKNEFEIELEETIKANAEMLLSKLTEEQLDKLNSIINSYS